VLKRSRDYYRGFGQERFSWYFGLGVRAAIKEAQAATFARPKEIRSPIVILFPQRSGSTWLVELLRALHDVVTIQDPVLERNAFLYARAYGFPMRHYYYERDELDQAVPYLKDVLRLKRGAPLDMERRRSAPNAPLQPVVKVSNAPWSEAFWAETFGADVFRLLRHPVHTARSQMRFFRMPMHLDHSLASPTVRARLGAEQIAFLEKTWAAGDEKRIRICEVFLENLPAYDPAPGAPPLIHYEDLVARDFHALEFVGRLDPAWREKFEERFDQPSRSTTGGEVTVAGGRKSKPMDEAERDTFEACAELFGAGALAERWRAMG